MEDNRLHLNHQTSERLNIFMGHVPFRKETFRARQVGTAVEIRRLGKGGRLKSQLAL